MKHPKMTFVRIDAFEPPDAEGNQMISDRLVTVDEISQFFPEGLCGLPGVQRVDGNTFNVILPVFAAARLEIDGWLEEAIPSDAPKFFITAEL